MLRAFEEKRADTRSGLSKGLGAFRIGRPLAGNNDPPFGSFPGRIVFLEIWQVALGASARKSVERFSVGRATPKKAG